MSDAGRAQFAWPHPGEERTLPLESWEPEAPGQDSTPLDAFCLVGASHSPDKHSHAAAFASAVSFRKLHDQHTSYHVEEPVKDVTVLSEGATLFGIMAWGSQMRILGPVVVLL